MDKLGLFQAALGLGEPWTVTDTAFDPQQGRLDVQVSFAQGARFACPEGDEPACVVHDTRQRTWRHLDFFQHKAFLHARVPRVDCPEHGVVQVEVPWARAGSGFTLLFEALLLAYAPHMPVAVIARMVGEHDTRIWRVLSHYVQTAREQVDLSQVDRVGIDETSAKRGQDYVSVFMDLTGRRVVFATEGRDASTVARFAQDLHEHRGMAAQVREVSADMSGAFARGVADELPNAQITFDRYHLVALLNDAVDEVRRAESRTRDELKGSRYVWLKRPENLNARQAETLAWLNRPSRRLATTRAYRWRWDFDGFYDQPAEHAEAYLRRWCEGAKRSRLEPVRKFVRTVEAHWDGVLRWHVTKITNGLLEGTNSLIQAAKRKARGYRTNKNLITMIYLIAGRLPLQSAHTG